MCDEENQDRILSALIKAETRIAELLHENEYLRRKLAETERMVEQYWTEGL